LEVDADKDRTVEYREAFMRWIIGDVHGMLKPLSALIGAIARRDQSAHLIFVGDYVNRGPDSRKVIDLLISLPRATFLRGNHDDVFDLLLHGISYIQHPGVSDPGAAFTWFMQHGLADTLISYGATWDQLEAALVDATPERIERLVKPVPASHRRFIRGLKPTYEADTFFVAHGFWHPDDPDGPVPLAQRLVNDADLRYALLWNRYSRDQIESPTRWNRVGYFGHTPVTNYPAGEDLTPIVGPNIVLLDTASALMENGMLSALCADNGMLLQADRAGKVS
jgi:serine/threonine protein phosphatase 1